MYRCPIDTTALLAQPLPPDANGNPRHFVHAQHIPVVPGSKLARKVGLQKYRGKERGAGFVIQSHDLDTTLREIYAALDHYAPHGAPHAFRSDGPLPLTLRLPDEHYKYAASTIEALAPNLCERGETFVKISIPSDLSPRERSLVAGSLMACPVLRSEIVAHLSHPWTGQYYGLSVYVWRSGDAVYEMGDLTDPAHDLEVISRFLAREEPPAR